MKNLSTWLIVLISCLLTLDSQASDLQEGEQLQHYAPLPGQVQGVRLVRDGQDYPIQISEFERENGHIDFSQGIRMLPQGTNANNFSDSAYRQVGTLEHANGILRLPLLVPTSGYADERRIYQLQNPEGAIQVFTVLPSENDQVDAQGHHFQVNGMGTWLRLPLQAQQNDSLLPSEPCERGALLTGGVIIGSLTMTLLVLSVFSFF